MDSNKSDAVEQQQSQAFQKLDSDVQTLITQIASGNVNIEDLLIQESKATRDMISTSLASEFKALDIRTVTEAQRQRLLKSLKSEEIRKRYNDIMSPSDACFERVFASYERVCSQDPKHKAWSKFDEALNLRKSEQISEEEVDEVDRSWDIFCSWLRSNDNVFWVQGKPGSGKSTLMKFIIDSNNTTRLLESWDQNARVLSYFFWKIGSESQNSIRGLLCSLLHDILFNDNGATEGVLHQFAFSQSKDYYKEWSTEEVDEVLFSLLHTSSRFTCIFIDGLDEISDKDGFRTLMTIVERLRSCPNVKLCTSSRPETELVSKIEAMRASSLRLEDLTRPEMAVYIHNKLDRFSAQISALAFERFEAILLHKAQGVFLWLFLAIASLTNGIENGDDESTLSDRLDELPVELEDLYESMWLRLGGNNRVYRETAAKYFNCIIYGGWDSYITLAGNTSNWLANNVPTLAHLSLVTKTESQIFFPPRPQLKDLEWLSGLCRKTAGDIRTRCAGMLQIGRTSIRHREGYETKAVLSKISPLTLRVGFIHRTAHDFLVNTESGQAILNYTTGDSASLDLYTVLIKAWLYLVGLYALCNTGFVQFVQIVTRRCMILEDKGARKSTILSILSVIQDLCEAGTLTMKRNALYPVHSLQFHFGYSFASFEDKFLSHYLRSNTTDFLTSSLWDIAAQSKAIIDRRPPVKLIQRLIALGGNPHAISIPPLLHKASEMGSCMAKESTAFELFIQGVFLRSFWPGQRQFWKEFLDIIVPMAQTCQDWHQKTLLIYRYHTNHFLYIEGTRLFWDELMYSKLPPDDKWVLFEVDMRFLLLQLMSLLKDCELPSHVDKLHDIVESFEKAHVRVSHIGETRVLGKPVCYRVLAQGPFQELINNFYEPQNLTEMVVSEIVSLMDRFSDMDDSDGTSDSRLKSFEGSFVKVPYAEELDFLAKQVRGLHRVSR